ncbi:hypothetical protein KFE94_13400 [bacterium SCSIO 12643]|nr:hypothetical protein KFE94_13400 [bacterium SCSIO 12643]
MKILRNILALIGGAIVGMIVNMGLILMSSSIIAPPPGADMTTAEGITAAMPILEYKHFIMPFLAHALGTLVGALVAGLVAASHQTKFALGIGAFFLLGGIANMYQIPHPTWFAIIDMTLAYIPMGILGGMWAMKIMAPKDSNEEVLDLSD